MYNCTLVNNKSSEIMYADVVNIDAIFLQKDRPKIKHQADQLTYPNRVPPAAFDYGIYTPMRYPLWFGYRTDPELGGTGYSHKSDQLPRHPVLYTRWDEVAVALVMPEPYYWYPLRSTEGRNPVVECVESGAAELWMSIGHYLISGKPKNEQIDAYKKTSRLGYAAT